MADLTKYKANVVWWNSSLMYVRCPYCDKIHRHGFGGDYHVSHYRVSHCENNESYNINFLANGLYKIDRSRGLYVSAGVDPTSYFAQSEPTPKVDVSNRRKWTEAREEVEIKGPENCDFEPFRLKKLDLIVSDMTAGRLQNVRHYLETSQEKDIFLHGVQDFIDPYPSLDDDDEDSQNVPEDDKDGSYEVTRTETGRTTTTGESALHFAACEMYPEMVELLLDFGADPNVKDVDGRTPLMEAALWGRLGNVKHLLSHGADNSIAYMRAGRLVRAIDFAADTYENSEERYRRSGGKSQVYKESTHERNKDRAAIIGQLYDEADEERSRNTANFSHLNGISITTMRGGRNTISLLANFDVPSKYKTIGILFRGDIIGDPGFPPVAAMSGWGHQPGLELNVQIGGRTWTDEVFRLCQIIGHKLPADRKDQGISGKFNACHAEKQLTAYFISKHVVLPSGSFAEDFGMSSLSLDTSQINWEGQDTLHDLQDVQPPETLRKGVILISRTICMDCSNFIKKVNTALGLMIDFRGANQYS
ncbi:hypothetical protein FSST1_010039 [Fusarium sambucinum]